jgi:hypothetical protein
MNSIIVLATFPVESLVQKKSEICEFLPKIQDNGPQTKQRAQQMAALIGGCDGI